MKKLLLISITVALFGCQEPTFSNGCNGDSFQEEVKCLRAMVSEQKRINDSLKFEIRWTQQKIEYECRENKQ